MKAKAIISSAIVSLALASCSSDEEIYAKTDGQTAQVEALAYKAPDFPANDGSTSLLSTNKNANLSKLLNAMDPARALSYDVFDVPLTESQIAAIKEQADELCASCNNDGSKITTLNDWVHKNVKYDYAANDPWTVFTTKKGVCQGYANLLKVMLLTQNIPAVNVNGWMNEYYAHAWIYAHDGTNWYVCDPTNANGKIKMANTSQYSHLQPDMADVTIFSDDNFDYNYYEGYLNVSKVKRGEQDLVVPFSINGFRVAMFNPMSSIPTSIQNIYIGSNIRSLGQNIIGLSSFSSFDEKCFVDPENKVLGSANGIVYWKDRSGALTSIYYIPSMMSTIILMPMERVEKNTILHQLGVTEIVFTEGTKLLESYAIEDCPNLRTVYVPEGCELQDNAIFKCSDDVQVVYGLPSAIRPIYM